MINLVISIEGVPTTIRVTADSEMPQYMGVSLESGQDTYRIAMSHKQARALCKMLTEASKAKKYRREIIK